MAHSGRTRDIVTSRRRRADEGEEDEAGSLDFDSQSEASALSGANDSVEGGRSDVSGHHPSATSRTHDPRGSPRKLHAATPVLSEPKMATDTPAFSSTADVNAMTNGLNVPSTVDGAEALQFDDAELATSNNDLSHIQGGQAVGNENRAQPTIMKPPPKITTTAVPDASRNPKRKGRESSGLAYSANPLPAGPSSTSERWNHDLHDLIENDMPGKQALPIVEDISRRNLPTYCTSAKGPEPLSRTVTIGHITLRVCLPGMSQPIPYEKTPLRYHIRLPDLRPPLRRDKPVRVSLPYRPPRYIFPSVDRSFIFIPRAQRPNQQGGRRPFGSRRNSLFGGSSYTPSIAMSRRSSVARDGIISPAGSTMTKPPYGAPPVQARPVVKLPMGARPPGYMHNGYGQHSGFSTAPVNGMSEPMYPPPGKPTYQSQWYGQIPVHQPRPQKTVSVTNIESPSREKLHAPQQHEHQPFHHQVPNHVNGAKNVPEQPSMPAPYAANGYSNAPLAGTPTHLPDTAVNAQPFQPDQPPMYYPASYPVQDMMYYPTTDNGTTPYVSQPMMATPMYMQPTVHGSYLVPMLSPATVPTMAPVPEAPQGMSAYEQNGTVYFYDASQYGRENPANGNPYSTSDANAAAKIDGGQMFYPPTNYYPTQQ